MAECEQIYSDIDDDISEFLLAPADFDTTFTFGDVLKFAGSDLEEITSLKMEYKTLTNDVNSMLPPYPKKCKYEPIPAYPSGPSIADEILEVLRKDEPIVQNKPVILSSGHWRGVNSPVNRNSSSPKGYSVQLVHLAKFTTKTYTAAVGLRGRGVNICKIHQSIIFIFDYLILNYKLPKDLVTMPQMCPQGSIWKGLILGALVPE